MTKVLLDTNIILDIALARKPFFEDSSKIFMLIDEGGITGCLSATSITDIYYIATKETNRQISKNFIKDLIYIVDVVGVDKSIILNAIESDIKDFEDAVQTYSAKLNDIEILVTRNKSDYKNSGLIVLTPGELFDYINKKG